MVFDIQNNGIITFQINQIRSQSKTEVRLSKSEKNEQKKSVL